MGKVIYGTYRENGGRMLFTEDIVAMGIPGSFEVLLY